MNKKHSLTLGFVFAFILTTGVAMADIQSPIYTDDIGRSHFLGRGGYSTMRQLEAEKIQADVINDAVDKYTNVKKDAEESAIKFKNSDEVQTVLETEKNITDVIKEKPVVPAASYKATFSYEKEKMDPSYHNGYGTNLPAGVNESKTIYKDDLGRLHFFGKANLIKE